MILGLSFGKKKQKIDQTTDVNKTETLTGSQSQATTGFQQGTSSTSSSGTQQTTGTQSSTTTTDQTQSDRGTQSQTGTTTTLGADVTAALSEAVKTVLGSGVNAANIANLSNMIAGRTSGFNPDQMVQQTLSAARNRGEQELQEVSAARESVIGGTAGTNSMAALLALRGRNDLETNLAGIEAATRAQAEGIANANLAAGVGAQGALADIAGGLAESAKGGTTTIDMTTLTDQISQLLGQQGAVTQTNQNVATAEQSNTATTQLIAELVNALTNQTNTTVGTEKTKGTTKSGGGGLSLSI